MKKIIRMILTWFLVCLVSAAGTLWVYGENVEDKKENVDLYAQGAALVDGDTGRLLYGENSDVPMAMASTTKIMTCLIALENSDMNDVVEISEYAASMPDVQLNAVAGDTFYMKDLLHSLMLESHNDIAVAIAEHIGGSEEGFADLMNSRARELGCKQTHFVTANGLDADGHYTTAEELARITIEALKNETFVKIINTSSYAFSNIEGTRQYQANNKNSFLYLMDGAFGVKTGFTNEAGYCFVGAATQNGETLISVVLGSGWPPNKTLKWKDTTALMQYGFEHYEKKDIGTNILDVGMLEIENGIKKEVVLNTECQTRQILLSDDDQVTIKVSQDVKKKAPVEKGEIAGWVYYTVNDIVVEKFPIYISETIGRKTFRDCLERVMMLFVMN